MNVLYIHSSSRRILTMSSFAAILMLLISSVLLAQGNRRVTGSLQTMAGQPVIGATVTLISGQDSIQTASDNVGTFSFANLKGVQFDMTAHSLGMDTLRHSFTFEEGRTQLLLPPLTMVETSQMIGEVTINRRVDIVIKDDTLEYNTKDLKLREGALAEDALKQLDGLEVDKDGNVTAQGEAITRIRVNGKDFFGGDLKAATRNLPADIIEKIQIVDDYGDMANITGNRTGDPERIINIQIDPSRNNGSMGNFRVGGGTEERYQATGMYGMMREGMQVNILGNLNNVNASLFDFNIRGSGARRGGGGGGGGGGFGGGGGGFGGGSGLTNTGSLGVNFRRDFSPAFNTYGNYSFSRDNNRTLSLNINDYFNENLIEIRDNQTGRISNSHRFDWNIEYKPTEKDYFKLSPTLRIQNTTNDGLMMANNSLDGSLITEQLTTTNTGNYQPSYGFSGLYNRRLSDHGRNLFFDFSLNTSSTEQDEERILETAFLDPNMDTENYIRTLADLQNKNLNGGASVSYSEPMGEFGSLEFNYDYNFRNYDNRRFDNALNLSGQPVVDDEVFIGNRIFDYSFITHRVGANYRFRSEKIVYSIGASVQPNQLKGEATVLDNQVSINRTGFNFAPIARFEYKFTRSKTFSIQYSGRANEPGFSQLQPFTDYSNRNAPVTGNPDLNAEFNHDVRIRFNNFDAGTGQSWFASVSGSLTEDRIVSNRSIRVDPELGVIQETSYLNTDGYHNMRANYHYSIPMKERTYVLSFMGMANYGNNISFTDDDKNIGQNYSLMQGLNFRFNPKETLEIVPGVRYMYNYTQNSGSGARPGVNNEISTWALTLNTSINITPTTIWGGDFAKTSNSGYNAQVGANPMIINTYLEQQFLKGRQGAVRFQAFDLLNEQTNVSRNVSDNLINDSRTNRLARYFMLTLSYRFQNFGGSSVAPDNMRGNMNMRGGDPRF